MKRERVEPVIAAVCVAAMCALAAWRRWRFLDSSPYPMGVDGYFYAGQLRSILEHGHLQWASSPLSFWLIAPLAAATDPIVGVKLGAAIFGALAGVPAYALGRRLGASRAAGLVACAIVTTSAGGFYLSIEFIKQDVGVTIALAALVAIARALEHPRRARIAIAVIALVATWTTHKVAAALIVVAAAPAIAIELRARGLLDRRRLGTAAIVAVVVVALAIVAGALFPARFLAARDLALVTNLFTLDHPRYDLPGLDLGDHALWIGHEALAGLFAVAAFVAALRPVPPAIRRADLALAGALACLAIVIALPWLDVGDAQGLAFRLRLVAFVPFALVGAAALGALAQKVQVRPIEREAALALFAVGWFAVQPAAREEGVVRAHPALVAAVRALDGVVPAGDTVIVTERHIEFMAAYYARVSVSLRPDDAPRARRWRLMPLAFIGSDSPLDHALLDARRVTGLPPPRGLHPRNPNGLVLVAEPTWDWVLDHVPTKTRAWARAWHTI